jgi:hypothetical protein
MVIAVDFFKSDQARIWLSASDQKGDTLASGYRMRPSDADAQKNQFGFASGSTSVPCATQKFGNEGSLPIFIVATYETNSEQEGEQQYCGQGYLSSELAVPGSGPMGSCVDANAGDNN